MASKRFSKSMGTPRKVNNHPHAFEAKADIRRRVRDKLRELGQEVHVFDAYGGDGQMHRAVWSEADSYTGCDLEWFRDERHMYCGDNARVLRAINLDGYNVFDLDAYGSPWEQAIIIAHRRRWKPGELFGVIFTDGAGFTMKFGGLPGAVATLTGLPRRYAAASRKRSWIVGRAVAGWLKLIDAQVVLQLAAERKSGAAMHYIGIVGRVGDPC